MINRRVSKSRNSVRRRRTLRNVTPPGKGEWFDTPEERRHRKHVHLTLPPDVIAMLTQLAKAKSKELGKRVSRSEIVEDLIRRARLR